MSALLESLRRVVAREIALLRDLLSPRGVFETVDEAIKIVREELKLASRVAGVTGARAGKILRG